MINYQTLQTFGWLMWRDIRDIKHDFLNNLIDALIIPIVIAVINGYILPHLGLPLDYGSFMVASSIVMMIYINTNWGGANALVQDLEGDRTISYELTLPLPSWMVFVRIALVAAINAMVLSIFILPVGAVILWNRFDIAQLNWMQFVISFITIGIFNGFFAIVPVSLTNGRQGFVRYQMRFGSQLLFFSGFQYTWATMLLAIPTLAYINLLNPLVYAFEAIHASILGQAGYINFWLCIAALWFAIVASAYLIVYKLKKKLDCI